MTGAQRLTLGLADGADAELLGDTAEHAGEPWETVDQRAVEVEDGEPISYATVRCSQGSLSSVKASIVGARSVQSSKAPRCRWISPGQRSPVKLIGLPQRPQKPRRTPGAEANSVGGPAGNWTADIRKPA